MTQQNRIAVSGRVRGSSGIGVIQHHLYTSLAKRFDIVELKGRDTPARFGRVLGLFKGLFTTARDVSGAVCVVSPLPLRNPRPLVTIVHDLRWMSGASRLKSVYRRWDLSRVVRQSDHILCVSQTTHKNLLNLFPEAASHSDWTWLGPGILEEGEDYHKEGLPGRFILLGADPRKRNDLSIEVLGFLAKSMEVSVTGVNLSESVRARCEELLGRVNCHWLERPETAQLIKEFQDAEYYLLLGTGEGFGLPFVEAMGTGTIPVTIDYDLSREVIGNAGVLLSQGEPEDLADQFVVAVKPDASVLKNRFHQFSWKSFADKVIQRLE